MRFGTRRDLVARRIVFPARRATSANQSVLLSNASCRQARACGKAGREWIEAAGRASAGASSHRRRGSSVRDRTASSRAAQTPVSRGSVATHQVHNHGREAFAEHDALEPVVVPALARVGSPSLSRRPPNDGEHEEQRTRARAQHPPARRGGRGLHEGEDRGEQVPQAHAAPARKCARPFWSLHFATRWRAEGSRTRSRTRTRCASRATPDRAGPGSRRRVRWPGPSATARVARRS